MYNNFSSCKRLLHCACVMQESYRMYAHFPIRKQYCVASDQNKSERCPPAGVHIYLCDFVLLTDLDIHIYCRHKSIVNGSNEQNTHTHTQRQNVVILMFTKVIKMDS